MEFICSLKTLIKLFSCLGCLIKMMKSNVMDKRSSSSPIAYCSYNQRSLRDTTILHGVCVGEMLVLKAICDALTPAYVIEQFVNRTQSNTNRSIAELNRTHNKILPIEHNRTFDYRTISNRTQSNVRLPYPCSIGQYSHRMIGTWSVEIQC